MAAPAIVGPLLAPLPTPIEALVSQWFHQDHPIENWDHYLERLVTMPVSDLWRSIDESKKKRGAVPVAVLPPRARRRCVPADDADVPAALRAGGAGNVSS